MSNSADRIVFYDGECGFCNRSVAFVLKNDKTKLIHFAPIQSSFTKELFDAKGFDSPDMSTFYYYESGTLYAKSSAAIKLAKHLKFPHNFLRAFGIVPRIVRDGVYDFIAKRRKSISKGFCVMPSEQQKKLFLS